MNCIWIYTQYREIKEQGHPKDWDKKVNIARRSKNNVFQTRHFLFNILKQGVESDMRRSHLNSSRTQIQGESSLIGEESFRYYPHTGRRR